VIDFLNACQTALPWPEVGVSWVVGFLSGFVTGLIYHRSQGES
jgi:hypothetical protein